MLSVIIGRFQTPYLHEGHTRLLEEAKRLSSNVLILIGVSEAIGTDKNPLDYETRVHLFDGNGVISNPVIRPLSDRPLSNKDWSDSIDSIISDMGYDQAIILGGRDNSIEGYYLGKHRIKIIDQVGLHSSTSLRKTVSEKPLPCFKLRSAIIYHIERRYPIVYSTIDVAIMDCNDILMGKKGDKFNFIGGFVDPADQDLHESAVREIREETGISLSCLYDLQYNFSIKVNDERYLGTKDCILTHFFSAKIKKRGLPISELIQDKEFKEFAWIPAKKESLDLISDCHKPLFLKFINLTH